MILRALWIVALVAFISVLLFIFFIRQSDHTPELLSKEFKNPYPKGVRAEGIVEAYKDTVSIGAPISGIIKKVYLKVGDPVKKGSPLFEMDNRDLIAQLYVQESSQTLAESNVKRLRDQLSRLREANINQSISQDLIKAKESDLQVADANLKQSQALVQQSKLLLERLIVTSPQEGVIIKNNLRPGAFLQKDNPEPFFVIGNLEEYLVRVDVPEQDAPRITPDQPTIAFLERTYKIPLKFERIEPFMVTKGEQKTLPVIYSFHANPAVSIYLGQKLEVYIDAPPLNQD